MGLLVLIFVGVLLPRLLGGGSSNDSELEATPELSPTPTPLALEAQDDVIQGGDSGREVAYPVNLQVILPDGDAPRVWVVQRRRVQASEWRFDLNPDTASFVNGMSVRPVIGIPWSEENAAWFASMGEGANFNLTMNTGAILHYKFAAKTDMRRSDTNIFRQVGPGLVLLLIGETDEEGLPTGQQALVFNLDVGAGVDDVDTSLWRVEVYDAGGQVYLSNTVALNSADYGAIPVNIPSLSLIPSSVGYIVPADFPGGRLVISDGGGFPLHLDRTGSRSAVRRYRRAAGECDHD